MGLFRNKDITDGLTLWFQNYLVEILSGFQASTRTTTLKVPSQSCLMCKGLNKWGTDYTVVPAVPEAACLDVGVQATLCRKWLSNKK